MDPKLQTALVAATVASIGWLITYLLARRAHRSNFELEREKTRLTEAIKREDSVRRYLVSAEKLRIVLWEVHDLMLSNDVVSPAQVKDIEARLVDAHQKAEDSWAELRGAVHDGLDVARSLRHDIREPLRSIRRGFLRAVDSRQLDKERVASNALRCLRRLGTIAAVLASDQEWIGDCSFVCFGSTKSVSIRGVRLDWV